MQTYLECRCDLLQTQSSALQTPFLLDRIYHTHIVHPSFVVKNYIKNLRFSHDEYWQKVKFMLAAHNIQNVYSECAIA